MTFSLEDSEKPEHLFDIEPDFETRHYELSMSALPFADFVFLPVSFDFGCTTFQRWNEIWRESLEWHRFD
jgi:hypothetical protein